jgi:hypothetical protein
MAQTKVKLISDGVIVQGNLHASHGITTADIGEGSNLYYTDARVGSYLSTNSFATESYVGTQIANLVDSSPSALNTLNELAAALGDDANFSTTVTNSIALKAPLASPSFTGNVGIGTTTLTNSSGYNTLSISGSSGGQIAFQTSGAGKHFIYSTATDLAFYNGQAGNLIFYTDGSNERMRIDSSGQVLIDIAGTNGSDLSTGGVAYRNNSGSYLQLSSGVHTDAAVAYFYRKDVGGTSVESFGNISNSGLGLVLNGGANSNQLVLSQGGNVGIGTNSPSTTFQVNGNTNFGNAAQPANTSNYINNFNNDLALLIKKISTGVGDYLSIQDSTGSSKFIVKSSGNVGIGETNPSYKLDVKGSGTNTLQRWTTTEGGALLLIPSNDAANPDWTFISGTNEDIQIDPANNDSGLIVKYDGKVGIGTDSPDNKLDVRNGELTVRPSSSGNGGLGKIGHSSSNAILQLYDSSGNEDVRISTSLSSYFNGGNVGIGTSSPSEKLHVNGGNIRISSVNNANHLNIQNNATGTSGVFEERIKFLGWNDNENASIIAKGNAYFGSPVNILAFSVSASEKMAINHSGNVAISGAGIQIDRPDVARKTLCFLEI